ncbi:sugar phosphate isomerase/epimerase family protein [Tengunoibacter tsumagoiensis]|uniref:Sugar phosphate isomerase n=1 Tax=Tengunoibacter tsumagoiensis TaxID=2014871 RepID=A0A401ZX31_9CHLR|nr:TIM barrel protein [Tengunoibacter tsumagoiensis]GCE11314.1 sugar phosphate isomerase [Tengunoibacter tsumagoiensis]
MSHDRSSLVAPRLSVSTWSLHRTLGDPEIYGPDSAQPWQPRTALKGSLSLLELPARLANFGIHTLEICHFHLPTLDAGYLAELRATLEQEKIELFSLLVDEGDLTHPTQATHHQRWIAGWIEIAGQLGAKRTRVIAGKAQPGEETLKRSAQALAELASQAETVGIRLMTENWFSLLSQPETVHALFEQLEGRVGLCLDFGNWSGPDKYERLNQIAHYAESCHTKGHFSKETGLDTVDYERCLNITHTTHFSGPYTLIYDGPDSNEWAGLARERQVVQAYLHP